MTQFSSPPPSPPIESQLVRTLLGGGFAVTAEINPPASADASALLRDVLHTRNRD